MRKKIAIVALFAVLGLGAGISLTTPKPRSYERGEVFVLPAHGRDAHSLDSAQLAAVVRSQHVHGIRVDVFTSRRFEIIGFGTSASGAFGAVSTVRRAINRLYPHYAAVVYGGVDKVRLAYSLWPGVIGLTLGLAIGFLVVILRYRRAVTKLAFGAAASGQSGGWRVSRSRIF